MSNNALNDNDTNNVPSFSILVQYIKDFSFENPNTPLSLTPKNTAPALNLQVDVNHSKINETDYEVVLQITAKAEYEDLVLFLADLQYAGIFKLQNIPEDEIQPLLLIEGARLLFPFAREILASATSNGGFAPLFIEPINFAVLYQNSLQAATASNSNEIN